MTHPPESLEDGVERTRSCCTVSFFMLFAAQVTILGSFL